MIRDPVVAGQFYPSSPAQLRAMIKGMVDEHAARQEAIGVVAPHAGYIYSGPVAGALISRIEIKDTFVIMGPNHTGYGKPFSIMTEGTWRTPLGDVEIDAGLADKLRADSKYLEQDFEAHRYEHSIEVQLPFLQYFRPDFGMVPIILGPVDGAACKEVGKEIARTIKELNREAVIVASSDMTHYESQTSARRKDSQAIEAILNLDEDELLRRVQHLGISMCGYAPTVAMLSAAKELGATGAELVKYQTSGDTSGDYSSVVGYAGIAVRGMSAIARLAKETVEMYIRESKTPELKVLTPEMKAKAGVFVSIHKHGELRGCIGTFEPTRENVAWEIISNAISSATRDPRFPPVRPGELKDLEYSVDVLTRPEPVPDESYLDCKRYGVIVECGWRRGLLLPDLEGVESVQEQIDICCLKGGIGPDEPMKLYRFEVKRYK